MQNLETPEFPNNEIELCEIVNLKKRKSSKLEILTLTSINRTKDYISSPKNIITFNPDNELCLIDPIKTLSTVEISLDNLTSLCTCTGAFSQSNGEFSQSNGAFSQSNGAFLRSSGAFSQSNGAFSQSNGAFSQSNGAFSQSNVVTQSRDNLEQHHKVECQICPQSHILDSILVTNSFLITKLKRKNDLNSLFSMSKWKLNFKFKPKVKFKLKPKVKFKHKL
jgi:hypothetical protein